MMARETTAEQAGTICFELEHFEAADGDRLELRGRWFGVRGRRFMRPTLTAQSGRETYRLLAVLDDKPWAAQDGESWRAVFPLQQDDAETLDRVELAVAPGIEVALPPPGEVQEYLVEASPPARDADPAPVPAADKVAAAEREPEKAPREAEAARREAEVARHELAEARRELDGARRELDRVRRELEEARRDLDGARREADDARRDADSARRELEEARVEVTAAAARRDATVRKLDAVIAERDSARSLLAETQQQLHRTSQLLAKKQAEIHRLASAPSPAPGAVELRPRSAPPPPSGTRPAPSSPTEARTAPSAPRPRRRGREARQPDPDWARRAAALLVLFVALVAFALVIHVF